MCFIEKKYCSKCEYLQIRFNTATCVHPNNLGRFAGRGDYLNPPVPYSEYIIPPWKRNKRNNCSYYKKGTPQPPLLME